MHSMVDRDGQPDPGSKAIETTNPRPRLATS